MLLSNRKTHEKTRKNSLKTNKDSLQAPIFRYDEERKIASEGADYE